MVKIRLKKVGKKNSPAYKIVVAKATSKRDGKQIEILGFYNPQVKENSFSINQKRYDYWKSVGAKPTEAVISIVENGDYTYVKYDAAKHLEEKAAAKEAAEKAKEEADAKKAAEAEKKEVSKETPEKKEESK